MDLLSLAEDLLESIQQRARKEHFSSVTGIDIEIGKLSEATPEAFRLSFQAVIKNTLIEGAKLNISETNGKALCLNCGHTNSITDRYSACEECGSFEMNVLSGDQVRIKHMNVV